jgi:hypothetical protein
MFLVLANERERSETISSSSQEHCSLFLAPSTIPNAGLGIFTAVELNPGDKIGYGDAFIPLVNIDMWHNLTWVFDNYTWNGASLGMSRESDPNDVVFALGLGLDSASNCNPALLNVESELPRWDDVGLHRSRNPGAGAIAQYLSGDNRATRMVPAGGELFKAYGDQWFQSREDMFGLIPLASDYTKANDLLRRFNNLSVALEHHIARALYDFIVKLPYEGRTLNAMPAFDDISEAASNGIESLHQPAAIRNIQELQSTGRCLDNIRPGRSTLPEAGRGAFATKRLTAGKVITGSPLFHFSDQEILFMRNGERNEKKKKKYETDSSHVGGFQLLLNYC